ncbi:MAG: SCO family protein [Candidatus Eiseniibacteriota bacterium]
MAFATVDLQRDLPNVLSAYLSSYVYHGHALRASSPQELASAEKAFGAASSVTRDAKGSLEVGHTATSYLVDERGRIVEEWGFGTTPSAMAADLRILLAEARR